METKLNEVVAALLKVADSIGDVATGVGVKNQEEEEKDPFDQSEEKQKEKDFKVQAKILAEAHFKAREKYDKKKKPPRKVVDDNGKKAVLNQVKSVGPDPTKTVKSSSSGLGDWFGIKGLLIGAGALIFGTMAAITDFFRTINKSRWFTWLKKHGKRFMRGYFRMLTWPFRKLGGGINKVITKIKESKWFKNLKNFFKPIGDFFGRIGTAIRQGKVGQLVGKLFKPITDWFNNLKMKITKGTGKFTFSNVGTYLKELFMGTPEKPGIFSKIKDIFTRIKDFVLKNPVLRNAVKIGGIIGRLVGKIFVPLTVLLGIIDGVTGFMKGFKEDGIIGGIKGAVIGIVDGLIGGLLRMIEGAMKWVAEALGLENFAAAINPSGFLQPVYDAFGGVVDFIAGIFTLDVDRMWSGVKGFFGGALDLGQWIIETPVNMAVNFLKDIFGFGDPDVPFDFGDWFHDTIWQPTVNFFKGIGDWWDDVWAESKRRWDVGVENVKKFFSSIGDWFSDVYDRSLERWNRGVQNIKNFFSSIGNWFSDVYDRSLERWNRGVENVKKFFSSVGDWFSDAYNKSLERFNASMEKIKNFFSSIGNWFSAKWDSFTGYLDEVWEGMGMLFDDPKAALAKIIPDWAQDFFGWMGDKLSSVWSGITGIFDEIANFDVGNWVKQSIKEHPGGAWLYDKLWGEEEKFAAAAAKEKKMLTGELKSNVSDTAAIENIVKETQAAGVRAGGDTYETRMTNLFDKMQTAVSDSKGSRNKLLAKLSSSDEKKILNYAAKTEGLDLTDKKAVDRFWNKIAGGYKDVWGTVNTTKGADNYMRSIAMTSAGLQLGEAKKTAGVNALLHHIKKTGQVQIGGVIIPVDTKDRWPPKVKPGQIITDPMIKSFGEIAKSKKYGDQLYKAALDRIGLSKMIADQLAKREVEALKMKPITSEIPGKQQSYDLPPDMQAQFDKNPAMTQEEMDALLSSPNIKKLDDFIWRPGSDNPVAFNKGDLLMGIHEESAKRLNAQSLQGSRKVDDKELIDRVDALSEIMRQQSEIHQETLRTLKESGKPDNMNTSNNVVGNNSNNTTVNNIQQDQSIMQFRDRTIGRISR